MPRRSLEEIQLRNYGLKGLKNRILSGSFDLLSPVDPHRVRLQREAYRGVFVLVILLLAFLCPGFAQEENKSTVISLGKVSGLANGQVTAPLLFAPVPQDLQVGNISALISFDNKYFSFVKAGKGFLLDSVNASFEVEVQKDSKDPNRSILHLEVSTKGESRKSIREGIVLTLAFHISAEAPAGAKTNLNFENLTAGDLSEPPNRISPIRGENGMIEVIPPEQAPYVACFFFSH
jgi:hypothetical protein